MDIVATGLNAVQIGEQTISLIFFILKLFLDFSVYGLLHAYMLFVLAEILIFSFCIIFGGANPFKIFSNFILYNYYVIKFLIDILTLFIGVLANIFKSVISAVIGIT